MATRTRISLFYNLEINRLPAYATKLVVPLLYSGDTVLALQPVARKEQPMKYSNKEQQ